MNAFETQSKKSEKDLQHEAVVELASRFGKNEMPQRLEDLQGLAIEIETEWKEDGYGAAASFVGLNGDLVMLARRQREVNDQATADQPNELRFLFDGQVVDTTIPSEMKTHGLNFRDGSVKIYDASQVDENSLPEGLGRLIEKFGEHMSIVTASPRQEVASLNGNYYDLRGVAHEVRHQQEERTKAEQEAYNIENDAKIAAGLVKKKLFMTARKHAALQDEVYRDSIRTSTAPETSKGPGLSEKDWATLDAFMKTRQR